MGTWSQLGNGGREEIMEILSGSDVNTKSMMFFDLVVVEKSIHWVIPLEINTSQNCLSVPKCALSTSSFQSILGKLKSPSKINS